MRLMWLLSGRFWLTEMCTVSPSFSKAALFTTWTWPDRPAFHIIIPQGTLLLSLSIRQAGSPQNKHR